MENGRRFWFKWPSAGWGWVVEIVLLVYSLLGLDTSERLKMTVCGGVFSWEQILHMEPLKSCSFGKRVGSVVRGADWQRGRRVGRFGTSKPRWLTSSCVGQREHRRCRPVYRVTDCVAVTSEKLPGSVDELLLVPDPFVLLLLLVLSYCSDCFVFWTGELIL